MTEHSKARRKQVDRFVWSGTDVTSRLDRRSAPHLADRAIALGETNSGGTGCDSKRMLALYALAAEMNVPVMIHFADFPHMKARFPQHRRETFSGRRKANPKPCRFRVGHLVRLDWRAS
jgi:glycine cleavage system aminomethyltransferase T